MRIDEACINHNVVRLVDEITSSIAEILNGEEDDEDGLCEPDTEADSEG